MIVDNIDTKTALDALRDLVTHCNLYLRDKKPPSAYLLQDIAIYITDILKVFGTIVERKEYKIGFPVSNDVADNNVNTNSYLQYIFLYICILFSGGMQDNALSQYYGSIPRNCSNTCKNSESNRHFAGMR